MLEIVEARTAEHISEARELVLEYAQSLEFDLRFQNFDVELKEFPGRYSPPSGCLLVALSENQPIGCVGLRYLEEGICEMKRLYVRPRFRGRNAGRKLVEAGIRAAKALGYERMRLDTVSSMEIANELYMTLGFVEIGPYRHNPVKGATYLELQLKT